VGAAGPQLQVAKSPPTTIRAAMLRIRRLSEVILCPDQPNSHYSRGRLMLEALALLDAPSRQSQPRGGLRGASGACLRKTIEYARPASS
jgi:hypothetical protein